MNSKIITPRFIFITAAILVAAISRMLPHPPNFTPIAAIALFGGACMTDKRLAFIIPLLAMIISDCIYIPYSDSTGFHNTLLYVYASFILITCIGIYIRNNAKTGNIILASLVSSILFFLITNFAVWAASGFQFGMTGLLTTYVAGIPFYNNSIFGSFFLNTIMGDLFYCGILFGAFSFAKSKYPALAA